MMVAVSVQCPKCGLRPVAGEACARCGLAVAHMAGWADDHMVPEALTAAWAACLAAWDDAAAHDRVADLARSLIEQPWLARRYRAVLLERPDDPVAAARLTRVAKVAVALLATSASTPPGVRFRRGTSAIVVALLALLLAGGLIYTIQALRRREAAEAQPLRERARPTTRAGAPWQQPVLRHPPAKAPATPPVPPSLPQRRVESRPPGE